MSAAADTPPPPAAPPRALLPKVIVVICAVIALVISIVGLSVRYGVLVPEARLMIEARANGLKIGRMGRLRIEGLAGDVWRDFTIRKLTIVDEKGVWLQADNVHMVWRYSALFTRRFRAERIAADKVTILRRPTLTPKGKASGMPVSFEIVDARARVEMLPAFSYRRGVYDLSAAIDMKRTGGQKGHVVARSVLHTGDYLDLRFELGKARPLLIDAKAEEAQGGALAGSLGLPADQPFGLSIQANGKTSAGRFTARATSGETTPLAAQGAWTPQGGQASGRVSLSASTLTAPYAARLGDEAAFTLSGRKAPGELYDLTGRADAANLTLAARGLGDIGKRRTGPAGLALDIASPDLTRLVGGPSLGAARVVGTLKGDPQAFSFGGSASVARFAAAGYGLDRVSGPVAVTRDRKELAVKARLTGAGGRGRGVLAALLGGAPRATFEGARLADGRLLIRDLQATGAGLKLKATGGRTLFGGLDFKGDAEVSNLAAARPGASGVVAASWTASQGGKARPWAFGIDAKGRKFASGLAELDRLLGAAPGLKAKAEIAGRKLSISQARLDGAALQATTAGIYGADGALAFKLDWSAEGPFHAGPVEIAGKARGSGAITGTLASPRADLLADVDRIDLPRLPLKNAHVTLSFARRPDGSAGVIAVKADSEYGSAQGRSAFRFPEGGVDLADLAVDAGGLKASGALSLRRNAPSAADLQVTVTPGAFLDSGKLAGAVKIVDAPGGAQASLNLTAENALPKGAKFAIRTGRVRADGPLSRLPYAAQAEGASSGGKWSLTGRGVLAAADPGYALSFEGSGRLGRRNLATTEPAQVRFGGPVRSARLRLAASDGGEIALDGKMEGDAADVRAQLQGVGLGVLNEDLMGTVDATLSLQGRGTRLAGMLDARLAGARGRGTDAVTGLDGTLRARLADDAITLDADGSNAQGLKANAHLLLPAEASAAPFRVAIARQRPMQGRFMADGEVKPLWDLLMSGERSLSGRVHTEGTIGGTLADPNAVGVASVDAGRFEDAATGLALRDVTLRASFADNAVNVTQATGADGHGGGVSGGGRISLLRNGTSSFRLDLKGFRLIDNEQATASASGQAVIDRNAQGAVRLSGALVIDRADVAANPPTPSGVVSIDVVERNRPVELESALQPLPRRGLGVALDVTMKAPRRVFLRGRGLDLEMSLDAHVGGDTTRPQLSGTARVVRGDYDFAGKRFEFDERGAVYLATAPQNIRLDLSATREDPSLTAVVRIRGTAAKPKITLTSTPVLPNDEVLSQVLFGRSASQLSPLEAAQLASALSALAGGGGFDVIGGLRNFAGLDRLALGGDAQTGVTVSGGKYLTEDVYLELTGGGREGGAAQVEWRFSKRLSIISRLAGQGDTRLSVRWRTDY